MFCTIRQRSRLRLRTNAPKYVPPIAHQTPHRSTDTQITADVYYHPKRETFPFLSPPSQRRAMQLLHRLLLQLHGPPGQHSNPAAPDAPPAHADPGELGRGEARRPAVARVRPLHRQGAPQPAPVTSPRRGKSPLVQGAAGRGGGGYCKQCQCWLTSMGRRKDGRSIESVRQLAKMMNETCYFIFSRGCWFEQQTGRQDCHMAVTERERERATSFGAKQQCTHGQGGGLGTGLAPPCCVCCGFELLLWNTL